jgi:hypothetical protein
MLIFTYLHYYLNLPPFLFPPRGKSPARQSGTFAKLAHRASYLRSVPFPREGSPDSYREGRGYNHLRNCYFIHDCRYSYKEIRITWINLENHYHICFGSDYSILAPYLFWRNNRLWYFFIWFSEDHWKSISPHRSQYLLSWWRHMAQSLPHWCLRQISLRS